MDIFIVKDFSETLQGRKSLMGFALKGIHIGTLQNEEILLSFGEKKQNKKNTKYCCVTKPSVRGDRCNIVFERRKLER